MARPLASDSALSNATAHDKGPAKRMLSRDGLGSCPGDRALGIVAWGSCPGIVCAVARDFRCGTPGSRGRAHVGPGGFAAAAGCCTKFIGGAEGNRTPDLCSAFEALSRLGYGSAMGAGIYVAGPGIVKKRGRRCPRFLADGRWRLPRDGAAHGRALVARSHQGRWIGAASPLVAERREHY